jgi:hypothetical protein
MQSLTTASRALAPPPLLPGEVQTVAEILDSGVHVDGQWTDGSTGLHVSVHKHPPPRTCCSCSTQTLAKTATNKRSSSPPTPHTCRQIACTSLRLPLVHFLLNRGANVRAARACDGRTPLHCAALAGSHDAINALLYGPPSFSPPSAANVLPSSCVTPTGLPSTAKHRSP